MRNHQRSIRRGNGPAVSAVAIGLSLSFLAAACGGSSSDNASNDNASNDTAASPGSTVSTTTTQAPPTTVAETTTTLADDVADEQSTDDAPSADFAVLVRGMLATSDMAEAKTMHDAVAGAGQAIAQEAGDVSHYALLGSTQLGSTENAFLALDQWTTVEGLSAFYSNPEVAAGFATLFSEPPTSEVFERRHDWHQWGSLDNGEDYTWVVVRGRLAAEDSAAAQAAHDQVAGGREEAALAAGDVAHVVFTSVEDPAEYLSIDVWSDATNLEAFYSNPDFAAAFATLFAGPPAVEVYTSTDWVNW